jgi:hypothetical protein
VDLQRPRARAFLQGKQGGFFQEPSCLKSPCVKVCIMDPQRDACIGCGRTLDEIARWGTMSHEERDAIMAALPARREKLALPKVTFEDGPREL